MRKEKIAIGKYYHILNRGNSKQDIFFDDRDRTRFLFSILFFQFNFPIYNISRQVSQFIKRRKFEESVLKKGKNRLTELVAFAFMPNHFHFILHEIEENGISKYMQRIQIAHTKYINTRYKKSGHLFQGAFKSVPIKNDDQLLYLSAYIHRNPRELLKWKNHEKKFFWSSYQDFCDNNRWDNLLKHQIITKQFSSSAKYEKFVKESSAKLFPKEHLL